MLSALKDIASALGVFSFLFIVYDRLAIGRPIVSLAYEKEPISQITSVTLRVQNIDKYDLLIKAVSPHPDDVYLVSLTEDAGDLIQAHFRDIHDIVLAPGQERRFFIASRFRDDKRADATERKVLFLVHWRRTKSTWLPQVPAFVLAETSVVARLTWQPREL